MTFIVNIVFLTTSGVEVNMKGDEKLYEVSVLVENW